MSDSVPNLVVLERLSKNRELDLASELFHRINKIIPSDQSVMTIAPECLVRDAVELMQKNGYSQIPVVQRGEVLGVFSFRGFAKGTANTTLTDWTKQRAAPGDLRVDDFLEAFEFARVHEEMHRVFDAMDRDDGVLIGAPERLLGILTPMDFLRYLYQVASPFVLVSEIELALRALIQLAMNPEDMAMAARACLSAAYGSPDNVPTDLEEMTFENYRSLISHGENWKSFEGIFGGSRTRLSGKLKEIQGIRNAVFHFKREIRMPEHQTLSEHRDWLLSKVKQAEMHPKQESFQ